MLALAQTDSDMRECWKCGVEDVRIQNAIVYNALYLLLFSGVLVVQVPGRYVVGSHIFQKVKTPPEGGKVRWGKGLMRTALNR